MNTNTDPAVFSVLRYAQVWEDADVLLAALHPQPGQIFLSVGSAGDNALALLARDPARVVAVDLNPAQIACLELRVAAFRRLEHVELLALIGSRPAGGVQRAALYQRCRADLSPDARCFWDARPHEIARGAGGAGKFERYFAKFRRWVLPLTHPRGTAEALLMPSRDAEARAEFYERRWNTWRWRALCRLFFSRAAMGWLGRDPSFFRYVDKPVSTHVLQRVRHALTALDPAANPYLHWILRGQHSAQALPFALREENFEGIRRNLDRLEWHCESLEAWCEKTAGEGRTVDGFNLSDVFEYLSPAAAENLLARLCGRAAPGARLVYWNMLAPRRRPATLADRLRPLDELALELYARDQAFFYSTLVVEERLP